MNKRGNIWLWVLLVIIVIVGCIILYYDGSNDVGLPDNSDEVVNLDSGIFDCGSNVDCLYSAMSECNLASATYDQSINMFGMLITTTNYCEIKGKDGDKCLIYTKVVDYSVSMDDVTKQKLKEQGLTDEQIIEQETKSTEDAKTQLVGKDGTCKYLLTDLVVLTNNWKSGNFSTEDNKKAECVGLLYNQ